jgi:hypothetical protein
VKILTNYPLEIFEARERFAGIEVVTFGPTHRMWVGQGFFRFDVAFDPENGSIEELLAICPGDFRPDVLLLYWPDQEPIPEGLERCPVPVAAVFSDYNLTLQGLSGLWPFFDIVLCDDRGTGVLGRFPFRRVQSWCQYSFRTSVHRVYPERPRRDLRREPQPIRAA